MPIWYNVSETLTITSYYWFGVFAILGSITNIEYSLVIDIANYINNVCVCIYIYIYVLKNELNYDQAKWQGKRICKENIPPPQFIKKKEKKNFIKTTASAMFRKLKAKNKFHGRSIAYNN